MTVNIPLIILAFMPVFFGIRNIFDSKKKPEQKDVYLLYAKVKCSIGSILGIFLSFLYCSYDFFFTVPGCMVALLVFYFIETLCNVLVDVKIKMDKYDEEHKE